MNSATFFRKARRAFELGKDILRGRRSAVFARPMDGVKVQGNFVSDIEPTAADVAICERLLRAYARATQDRAQYEGSQSEDIWTAIARRQGAFFQVLGSNNPSQLAAYLCNMSRHDATHGTVQGEVEYRHLKRSARYRTYIGRMAKDKLVSLAEALGAIPSENPEQGSWARNGDLGEADLAKKIEAALGISIIPPAIDGGLFKVGLDPYRFGERDCNAIYTAWLMRQLLAQDRSVSVCEIGGGVGRVAYWATQQGIDKYTLLDLPHINVLQGFYLLKALPDAHVLLYGESQETFASLGKAIRVMPGFTCKAGSGQSFDLVLNQDSFPEIHEGIVLDYLKWIKASAPVFLSINHESQPNLGNGALQNNVPHLIAGMGGFSRESRNQYWLRRGYVTEVYRVR